MYKDRTELEVLLTNKIKKDVGKKKVINDNAKNIEYDYSIPLGDSISILTLSKPISDCDNRRLYCYLDYFMKNKVDEYFTPNEIKKYSKVIKNDNQIFPLKFDVVEIVEGEQWVGKITVKELMRLRDYQIINYNTNAQRSLKRKEVNGQVEYVIAVNKQAVKGIEYNFKNNTYIPNTITLNIPIDSDFHYEFGQLTIDNAECLDILDGYHRYLAMSSLSNINSNFDYPMELRLFSIEDEKAKQFIWQEDQKTKMKRLDSDTYNQNSNANKIINMINSNPMIGNIIVKGSVFNPVPVMLILNHTFLKGNKNSLSTRQLVDIKNRIINLLINLDVDKSNRYDDAYTIIVFYCIYRNSNENNFVNEVSELYNSYASTDQKFLSKLSTFNGSNIKKLESLYNKVVI